MSRPRLSFSGRKIPMRDGDIPGYRIYASYRRTASGEFFGVLKVVRTRDARLVFPFEGAPDIGPYAIALEAREAAHRLGETIVSGDQATPEP
jgi:hypothetical protein